VGAGAAVPLRDRAHGTRRPGTGPLRERPDPRAKRKAIENEPNGDPNDSAPEYRKTAKPLFVL
jgi:hypothetical protein